MRMIRGLVVAAVAVVLFAASVSAQDKAKKLLVGKWESTIKFKVGDEEKEIKIGMEFTKDGETVTTVPGREIKGKYKVVDDENIEVTAKVGEEEKTQKLKIKVSKDELEITGPNRTTKFKRAKEEKKKDE